MTHRFLLEGVVRRFRQTRSRHKIEALRIEQFAVRRGEILAVVGPNGSGKSTLLEAMAFLARPDEGRVLLDGQDVWATGRQLAARRRCPMLLQKTVLFGTSVLHNVMYGLRVRGMARAEARRRALKTLAIVGMDSLAHRASGELSGGQRQRISLARLLALEPETLLLDEPTAHVDFVNEQLIEEAIRDLHRRLGTTVILASHNLRQAKTLADRVITLVDGSPIPGTMDNLFTGSLARDGDEVVFRDESGPTFRFPPEAVRSEEDGTLPLDKETVQIAIDADRLLLEAVTDQEQAALAGTIASVRRRGDRCRLRIHFATGRGLHAEMTRADYGRLGLNLDTTVAVTFGPGAVRVFPTGG
ncbi:MAG: ABC transporter ATP-binding protein [Planctomycetes bacterium]|nr:ABC transporter ATP-binding protein [Planctomycetota bacterium]